MRDFHVRREPRDRYALDRPLIGTRGDLVDGRPGRHPPPGRPDEQRPARRAAVHPGRRDRRARPPPRDRPPAHRALRGRPPARARWRPRWPTSRRGLGPDAGRLLDRFGEEFPGPGPDPEPRDAPARGAAADPRLQREPRGRPAHRAGRRPAARRRARATATRSRELEATFADGPPMDGDGLSLIELMRMPARRVPDLARRPAALHPATAGGPSSGPVSTTLIRRARPRDRHPRRGGARAPPALRRRRRGRRRPAGRGAVVRRAPPTSPRRSRPIRRGCRASC